MVVTCAWLSMKQSCCHHNIACHVILCTYHAISADAHLHIDGGLELLNVLIERLCLSPAGLCQVCVLVHDADVVEALPMPDKVDDLHTQLSTEPSR